MIEKEGYLYSIADTHVHTNKSDGIKSPRQVVFDAKELAADIVCVTDHDTMDGVDEAVKAGEEFGIWVIKGQEITTNLLFPPGHIVGLNIEHPIRSFKGLNYTIDAIKDQNGLVILPHPGVGSFNKKTIEKLVMERRIDAIEICSGGFEYQNLRDLIDGNIAVVGGSDSHFGAMDLGCAHTLFPGNTDRDLLNAIKEKKTIPVRGPKPRIPISERVKQTFNSIFIFGPRKYVVFAAEKIKS